MEKYCKFSCELQKSLFHNYSVFTIYFVHMRSKFRAIFPIEVLVFSNTNNLSYVGALYRTIKVY